MRHTLLFMMLVGCAAPVVQSPEWYDRTKCVRYISGPAEVVRSVCQGKEACYYEPRDGAPGLLLWPTGDREKYRHEAMHVVYGDYH